MKHFVFIVCMLFAYTSVAQNSSILSPTTTLTSDSQSEYNYSTQNKSKVINLQNNAPGQYSIEWAYGLYSRSAISGQARSVGVLGLASISQPQLNGRAFGVMGVAGNATSGYNFGVWGGLQGSNEGSAVFGTIYDAWSIGSPLSNKYAGYFEGPVSATQVIKAPVFTIEAGDNHNQSISSIDKQKGIFGLQNLCPIEYTFTPIDTSQSSDTVSVHINKQNISDEFEVLSRRHYGLLAKNVQEVYPELVYEDRAGNLSIDYIGLIPLLIQTIQELTKEMDLVKSKLPQDYLHEGSYADEVQASIVDIAKEKITLFISENVHTAKLTISDFCGNVTNSYDITERGDVLLFNHKPFEDSKEYIYSLYVDGKLVSTRTCIASH